MPHYYFHVFNDEITLDEEGKELPDLDAAREYAIANARALICEVVQQGHLHLAHRVEITDDQDERLMTVTFREAVTIIG